MEQQHQNTLSEDAARGKAAYQLHLQSGRHMDMATSRAEVDGAIERSTATNNANPAQQHGRGYCAAPFTPEVVAWFNPAKPNAVINAAQYPHVLDKNKVGYVACIVNPKWVHILTYEERARMEDGGEWRRCRVVFANHDSARKHIDGLPQGRLRNVSIVGSLLRA